MKRALVFINSNASQAHGSFEKVAGCLGASGIEVVPGAATCASDYIRQLQGARDSIDLVAAGGGDGTIRCAAEAIVSSAGKPLPLGIVPLGTANNVARSLGLPMTVPEACAIIAAGRTVPMDLARVNGRLFVSVVGMGLSTRIHREVRAEDKSRWKWLSYVREALRIVIQRPASFRAEITWEGGTLFMKAAQVTICNGKYYGGVVEVHPDATLSDGLLRLSAIEAPRFFHGALKALLPMRVDGATHGLTVLQGRKFEVRTRPVIPIDVEGSTDLHTPASFEILPGLLRVITKVEQP